MTTKEWIEILGLVFMVSSVLTVGLEVTRDELLMVFHNRPLTARILLANFIIVPLLGLLLVEFLGIRSDFGIGFLLMALAPGGFYAIQFTGKVKSHLALAASSLFILSTIALVVTPLIARLLLNFVHVVTWKYINLTIVLGFGQFLPLLLGLSLKKRVPSVAAKLRTPMAVLSNVSFVSYVIVTATRHKEALRAIEQQELAAVVSLILASLLVGWWAGGSGLGPRLVTGASTSLRNAPICLAIAMASMPQPGVRLGIVVYMGLMIPINTIFVIYGKVRVKRLREALDAQTLTGSSTHHLG